MTYIYATGDPGRVLSYAWGVWWSAKKENWFRKIAHASDDDHIHKGDIYTNSDTHITKHAYK